MHILSIYDIIYITTITFRKVIKKEMRRIEKDKAHPLRDIVCLSSLESFSWKKILHRNNEAAPVVSSLLKTVMTSDINVPSPYSQPRLGLLWSIILHNRSPISFKYLQAMNSVQLWRANCKTEVGPA